MAPELNNFKKKKLDETDHFSASIITTTLSLFVLHPHSNSRLTERSDKHKRQGRRMAEV
jgi:hypothetical protein